MELGNEKWNTTRYEKVRVSNIKYEIFIKFLILQCWEHIFLHMQQTTRQVCKVNNRATQQLNLHKNGSKD